MVSGPEPRVFWIEYHGWIGIKVGAYYGKCIVMDQTIKTLTAMIGKLTYSKRSLKGKIIWIKSEASGFIHRLLEVSH